MRIRDYRESIKLLRAENERLTSTIERSHRHNLTNAIAWNSCCDMMSKCRKRAEAWKAAAERLAEYAAVSNPSGCMVEIHERDRVRAIEALKAARKLEEAEV